MGWWEDLDSNPIFNAAAGVATGGLYTAGRAGVDYAFNGGQQTQKLLGNTESMINSGVKKGADMLGLNPREVNGFQFDPSAASMPGYDDWKSKLAAGAQGAGARMGPTLDTGPQSQVRAQQDQLSQMLMDQAMGRGPSVAQDQLRQATDRNMSQAMALGASQGAGSRSAGVLRQVGDQRAQIGQQMAGDSSMLRLQEQLGARQMLGQQLGGMRGQDMGLASEQARLALQSQAQNDDLVKFYTQAGMSLDQAQMAARMEMQRMQSGYQLGNEQLQQGAYNTAMGNRFGLMNAAGSIATKVATGGVG